MRRLVRTTVGGSPRVIDADRYGRNAGSILRPAYTALANRQTQRALVLWLGDSITVGAGPSTLANSYVRLATAALQQRYPAAGAESAVLALGDPIPATGVVSVIGAISGSTTASTINDARLALIAAHPWNLINLMIGTNDAYGTHPAIIKANIRYWLDRIQAAVPAAVFALHRTYARMDITGVYTWNDYGTVFAELAAEDPTRIVYRDHAPAFEAQGVPGADPNQLLGADKLHPTDAGSALLADRVKEGIFPDRLRPTAPTVATPIRPYQVPVVTGTGVVGSTLTVSNGTWSQDGLTVQRQWWRDGVRIGGASDSVYTLVSADAGKRIDAQVIVSKSGYASASYWTSKAIAA